MKKFMKGCAITALVFGALGFILGMAGSAMAGRASIAEAVRNATGGRVHMNPAAWWIWMNGFMPKLVKCPMVWKKIL